MKFSGRLALQQRVLPHYRAPFFDLLAENCEGGLSLFAGEPRPEESIKTAHALQSAQLVHAKNRHILNGSLYFCYQEKIIDWLADTKPDALILEANPRYLATPAAIKWMRERGRPVIGWGLGAPIRSGLWAGFRQKNWMRFLNQFDALIAYSQRGAADYAVLGIPREKIFVAQNAAAPRPDHLLARSEPTSPATILFVGRLQARKRINHLLHACADLPADLQPNLLIVGEGPERTMLEELAAKIYPQTEFLGAKHGSELDEIWQKADLFTLPGTGGLAVQEAMVHGLPVIVAKGDGTQDDLVRNQNGWQIPPDDLMALKAALAQSLSDLPRLREMGVESYRIVKDEVNIEKMLDIFVMALEQAKKTQPGNRTKSSCSEG